MWSDNNTNHSQSGENMQRNCTLLADFGRSDDNFPIHVFCIVRNIAHGANFFSNSVTIEGHDSVSFAVPRVPVFDDFRFMDHSVDKISRKLFNSSFVVL